FGRELSSRRQVATGLMLAIFFVAPLVWPQLIELLPSSNNLFTTSLGYFSLAFVTVLIGNWTTGGTIAALLFVGVANAMVSADVRALSSCTFRRDAYLSIIDSHRRLTSLGQKPDSIYLWFDEHESANARPCNTPYHLAEIGYSLRSTGFQYLEWPPWP